MNSSFFCKGKDFSVLVESPYFDILTKELNPELETLIIEFTKTFMRQNTKARSRARNYSCIKEYIYNYKATEETEKNAHLVQNIDIRGVDNPLDHIIPVSYGFDHNIPIEIIGSNENLQIITMTENLIKSNKITPQVINKLKFFGLNNNKKVEHHTYDLDCCIYSRCSSAYLKRIKEGCFIKYYSNDYNLLHSIQL